MFERLVFAGVAVVAAALGGLALVVVAIGLWQWYFPFRPRASGTAPDGERRTLRRSEEPVLFWVVAVGMSGVGLVMLWLAGSLAVKVFREMA